MHKHHIKPKHSGGEDVKSNLTPPISVVCHAMFHWCEWQRTGNVFDKIAWKTLTGQIGKEEARILATKESNKKRIENETHPFLPKNRTWDLSETRRKSAKTQLKNGTLSLLHLDISSISKKVQKERIKNGTHHFLRGNETWNRKETSRNLALERVKNGTHQFLRENRTADYSKISKEARKNMSQESLNKMIRSQTINRRINKGWTYAKLEFIYSIKHKSSNKILKECQEKFNWPNSRGVIQNILRVLDQEGLKNLLNFNFIADSA